MTKVIPTRIRHLYARDGVLTAYGRGCEYIALNDEVAAQHEAYDDPKVYGRLAMEMDGWISIQTLQAVSGRPVRSVVRDVIELGIYLRGEQ